jgi:hypothetical protein
MLRLIFFHYLKLSLPKILRRVKSRSGRTLLPDLFLEGPGIADGEFMKDQSVPLCRLCWTENA